MFQQCFVSVNSSSSRTPLPAPRLNERQPQRVIQTQNQLHRDNTHGARGLHWQTLPPPPQPAAALCRQRRRHLAPCFGTPAACIGRCSIIVPWYFHLLERSAAFTRTRAAPCESDSSTPSTTITITTTTTIMVLYLQVREVYSGFTAIYFRYNSFSGKKNRTIQNPSPLALLVQLSAHWSDASCKQTKSLAVVLSVVKSLPSAALSSVVITRGEGGEKGQKTFEATLLQKPRALLCEDSMCGRERDRKRRTDGHTSPHAARMPLLVLHAAELAEELGQSFSRRLVVKTGRVVWNNWLLLLHTAKSPLVQPMPMPCPDPNPR